MKTGNSFNGQLVDLAFGLFLSFFFWATCGLRAMKRKKGLLNDKITLTYTYTHSQQSIYAHTDTHTHT